MLHYRLKEMLILTFILSSFFEFFLLQVDMKKIKIVFLYPFRAGIQTWICGEGTRHGQNMASSDLCGDAVFVCILKPSFGIQVTNTIHDFVILETKFLIKHMQLIEYNIVHYFQWRKYDGPLQPCHLLRSYVGTRSGP